MMHAGKGDIIAGFFRTDKIFKGRLNLMHNSLGMQRSVNAHNSIQALVTIIFSNVIAGFGKSVGIKEYAVTRPESELLFLKKLLQVIGCGHAQCIAIRSKIKGSIPLFIKQDRCIMAGTGKDEVVFFLWE